MSIKVLLLVMRSLRIDVDNKALMELVVLEAKLPARKAVATGC